jgi:CIC family chloride channel protein
MDLKIAASPTPERSANLFTFSLIAVGVGLVTGFGAVLFRDLIGLIHNLFFLGQLTAAYDANVYTPASPWGPFVILVPVVGGLGVVFLVRTFAPEAKGHGVPEVMDAIFYNEGRIRPVVAAVKSLASALAIGSGSAVGREGPIIQIGASLGSSIGQIIRLEAWQRITLVAAGAGAGIAATFNTPIGGVIFAIELMMPEVSTRTFLPVALATGTATFVGRLFFGPRPAFNVPAVGTLPVHPSAAYLLIAYAVLGAITGVGAAAFIRGLHWTEDRFDRIGNPYLRHAIGMSIVGCMMYTFLRVSGHYQIDGVGYATVEQVTMGAMTAWPFLALLFAAKLCATSLSLGSGSSGGIFSPSLYMGATLGGAFGSLLQLGFPGAGISVPAFAMVGMAAMVGGGTGAAMTAVTMIFEMTLQYSIVMPMIKLLARRHFIPKALHANMFLVRRAADVMEKDFLVLPHDMTFDDFLRLPGHDGRLRHVVVARGDAVAGVLRVNTSLRKGLEQLFTGARLERIASPEFTIARDEDIMFRVIGRMWRRKATMAVVVSGGRIPRTSHVVGIITKEHIADSVAESIRPYAAADALL